MGATNLAVLGVFPLILMPFTFIIAGVLIAFITILSLPYFACTLTYKAADGFIRYCASCFTYEEPKHELPILVKTINPSYETKKQKIDPDRLFKGTEIKPNTLPLNLEDEDQDDLGLVQRQRSY